LDQADNPALPNRVAAGRCCSLKAVRVRGYKNVMRNAEMLENIKIKRKESLYPWIGLN